MFNTATPGECEIEWEIKEDYGAIGAIGQSGRPSEDECIDLCVDDLDCLGLDFQDDANQPCWLHFDANNLENGFRRDGVRQYILISRCEGKAFCFGIPWSYCS